MSGQSIFKKLLLEKENATGRRQLINAGIGLATTFTISALAYSSLTYLAAQPALSQGPEVSQVAEDGDYSKLLLAGRPNANTNGSTDGSTSEILNFSGKGNAGQAIQSSFAANAGKSAAPVTDLSQPESGVKLLLSIFTRLWNGSGSQIAMLQDTENRWAYKPNAWGGKAKAPRDTEIASAADQLGQQQRSQSESQLSQALNSNVADPALSIRPQVSKRAALDDISASQSREKPAAPAQMAMQSQAAPASVAQQSDRAQAANRNLAGSNFYGSNRPIKIVSESPDIREFGQEAKHDQDSRREQTIDTRTKALGKRQVNIVDEPLGRARMDHANLIEQSKEMAGANGNGDSVTGIIRPSEQPGLFKYVREYYKENLKAMPPPAAAPAGAPLSIPQVLEGAPIVTDAKMSEENEKQKNEPTTKAATTPPTGSLLAGYGGGGGGASAGALVAGGHLRSASAKSVAASFDVDKDMGRGFDISNFRANKKKSARPLQIAFLPPNAVHGIAGLSLGATTSETTAFFKTHGNGKFSKMAISGFQIFTLKGDHGVTALQAFVRNERLEALRVFSSTYVPTQLGINLGEDLPSMKAKFGEPAFILEEPRLNEKAPPVVAKNYVYPVSQVSFQLSRRSASSAPQVLSMFLFRFL